jgi:hypothetical protein
MSRPMRVLVACECSGVVRDAFRRRGHDAVSCDLQESEAGEPHIVGDARSLLNDGWDLLIAHPPCTYLSRAGARWWSDPERQDKALAALELVSAFRDAPIRRIAIENPIGQLNKLWRYPDQTVQPWHFGHPYSKATCLWLKNLPPLLSTDICGAYTPLLPSNVGAGKRKGQRSHQGLTRSARDASRTFRGIAEAMASQWGSLLTAGGRMTVCTCMDTARFHTKDCPCAIAYREFCKRWRELNPEKAPPEKPVVASSVGTGSET